MTAEREQEGTARRPKLLLLAGVTAVGKSTLARRLATELGFQRVVSTDSIREVLRSAIDPVEDPALHRSSFSIGANNSAVLDWLDTCEAVRPAIQAVIDRARREGIDLIVEGVHVLPENHSIRRWQAEGGVALGVLLHVRSESGHREMLQQRESETWRNADRYLAAMDRIRTIQTGLLERGRPLEWQVLDVNDQSDAVEHIAHLFDLEWNRAERGS